jgi:hypothetical protein
MAVPAAFPPDFTLSRAAHHYFHGRSIPLQNATTVSVNVNNQNLCRENDHETCIKTRKKALTSTFRLPPNKTSGIFLVA